MGKNAASTRMTYGRFLEYLDDNRVAMVDLYDGGRTAIVEAVDPDLDNRVQRVRVDLPANAPELITKLKEKAAIIQVFHNGDATVDGGPANRLT